MIDPDKVKANQARMEAARSNYDTVWALIARLVFPEQDNLFSGGMGKSKWLQNQPMMGMNHEPYTTQALEDGVSVFESYVMPKGQRWQKLELGDESLMRKVAHQQWLEAKEKQLFSLRNDPRSGFVGNVHESAMSIFSFGPQSLWVDKRRDQLGRIAGLSYQSEFVGDVWIERDAEGNVMRSHRAIELTAEQALAKWGDDAPPKVREYMTGPNAQPNHSMTFLHVIEPNRAYDPERLDAKGKVWSAGYWSVEDEMLFKEGGYNSQRRIVSCFNRSNKSTWGRSPSMKVLSRVCMELEIWTDRVFAAELNLKPPLLLPDDDIDVVEIKPFGLTFGGMNERGEPMVREMLTNSDARDAQELSAEAKQLIDRVFYRDLLQLNREYKSHIPAARIAEESAEKGLLLSPLAIQEQHWLSPMTEAELVLMAEIGLFDDAPPEVAEYLAYSGGLGIRYDNGLTALQEAGKSAAFLNLASQVGSLAQFDPSVVDDFRREFPMQRVIPELARIAGVPASMRATEEEREAFDADKAQKAQLDQLLKTVPVLTDAAQANAAGGQPLPQGGLA
ncbi:portal protein [Novosphingobium sp. UBA1939]|uniref:portal protein n=1 Tax=Novosphingobium sp. UBA1939 TaxID=1946982 RepID=UPI0025FAE316|nr:portal protein [Novosphingobium sp. UBA1939]